MGKTILRVVILEDTKSEAEKALKRLGVTPEEAIRLLYAKLAAYKKLPFDLINCFPPGYFGPTYEDDAEEAEDGPEDTGAEPENEAEPEDFGESEGYTIDEMRKLFHVFYKNDSSQVARTEEKKARDRKKRNQTKK